MRGVSSTLAPFREKYLRFATHIIQTAYKEVIHMTLGQRIAALRGKFGWTQEDIAKKLNVRRQTVSGWERDERALKDDTLQKLADIFEVSVDYIMGRTSVPIPIDDVTPNALISGAWPLSSVVRIPVLGQIQAGEPFLAETNIDGWEEVPSDTVRDGDYFFLRVKGDSMRDARIEEGDLVLVRQQPDVEDGEIAVVMVGVDEACLRRVKKQNGHLVLWSANPHYPPLVVRPVDTRIIGRVVRVWFEPK
jgi:repressor LexA